jgi:hypothetical protein
MQEPPKARRYEYHLTFLQMAGNPPGALLARTAAVYVLSQGAYFGMLQPTRWGIWLSLLVLSGLFWWWLFSSCIPWRRPIRVLEFTKQGLRHVDEASGTFNYAHVRIHPGLMGTWIIRNLSGHFVIVPKTLFSESEFRRVVDEVGRPPD